MPGKRLKVFQAHLGFFETIVAAPSQKAALEAWGSRQDLFHTGLASVATEADAVRTALSRPGIVLKRPAGSHDAYTSEPGLPKVKAAPKKATAATPAPRTTREPFRPVLMPDRGEFDRAEQALAALQREIVSSEEDFARRRKALLADEQESRKRLQGRKKELERRVNETKRVYEEALKSAKAEIRRRSSRSG